MWEFVCLMSTAAITNKSVSPHLCLEKSSKAHKHFHFSSSNGRTPSSYERIMRRRMKIMRRRMRKRRRGRMTQEMKCRCSSDLFLPLSTSSCLSLFNFVIFLFVSIFSWSYSSSPSSSSTYQNHDKNNWIIIVIIFRPNEPNHNHHYRALCSINQRASCYCFELWGVTREISRHCNCRFYPSSSSSLSASVFNVYDGDNDNELEEKLVFLPDDTKCKAITSCLLTFSGFNHNYCPRHHYFWMNI